ncbi:MAG TPA: glycosyltransferase [Thermoanaerobaculia bacterium]|nr:glycosyltransferase [Thermoanaerobaculia bacterium]
MDASWIPFERSEPLRIAQIAGVAFRVPPRSTGGTELVIANLTRGLRERGHRVTLFASGDSRTDAELRSVLPRAAQDDPSSNLYLERELDVRNVFEAYGNSGDFDVIHAHWPTPAPYFSATAPCPTLLTFDYMEKSVYEYYRERFPRLRFACVSRAQADALDPGLPVVANGIDVDRVPFGRSPGGFLLTVGRLVPSKGAAAAIEIARRSGLPLVIVGDVSPYLPESRRYYESEIAPHVDGSRVVHHPRLPNREVLDLMSRARAFLFPIEWEEPFGLVAAEAMAAGTPVIATPRGALPELVEEGVTGWLGATIDDLVAAAGRTEAFDRRRCRDRARERFGYRRMAANYEKLYLRIAREAPARARRAAGR